MDTTQHAGNPPAENRPFWQDPFFLRRLFFAVLFFAPISLVVSRFAQFLVVALAPGYIPNEQVQDFLRILGIGLIIGLSHDFIENDRKKNLGIVRGSSDSNMGFKSSGSSHVSFGTAGVKLPFGYGEAPFTLKMQAFSMSVFAYTVYSLFCAWLLNLLPGKEISYGHASVYGILMAMVGFYGYRAERATRALYVTNRDLIRFPGGDEGDGSWVELRAIVVASFAWLCVSIFSLYKGANERVFAWMLVPVFATILTISVVLWPIFKSLSRKHGRKALTEVSDEPPKV